MPFLLSYGSRDTRHVDFPRVNGLSTDTPDLGRHNIFNYSIYLSIILYKHFYKTSKNN